jgi:hypothetical protein
MCISSMSYFNILSIPVWNIENTAIGIRHADHVAPFIRKSWH